MTDFFLANLLQILPLLTELKTSRSDKRVGEKILALLHRNC
jgi:hypothetical protein